MAIDKIDWHYGGDFPKDLAYENGGTHIGMYLTWILINNLHGEVHRETEQDKEAVNNVISRKITGLDFLINHCDGKFWDEDLNEIGNEFTEYYYKNKNTAKYFDDYCLVLDRNVKSIYHIENTWENFELLEPILNKRYIEWKENNKMKKIND